MYYEKAQLTADAFKAEFHDTIIDSKEKQETLVRYGFVKQNTISQWLDPQGDRHLPAFELSLLPESITVPLCKFFLKRFNKVVMDVPSGLKLDGNIDDNLLAIDVFQAKIIELHGNDPKKIIGWCEKMGIEIATIKREAELKLK